MPIFLKMLVLALLLPLVTGFVHQEPRPDAASRQQSAADLELQMTASPQPSAEAAAKTFNWRRDNNDVSALAAANEPGPTATTPDPATKTVHSWETGAGKSHLIPALEVPGFLILLNIRNRFAYGDDSDDYEVTFSSTWRNLRRQNWEFDTDPFKINQFGHPYQGATMYGLARSTGLDFWESTLYSNLGSFVWEMAGETDTPSINDMATTGTSGSLLGEALFRMSELVLHETGTPDLWHELGAAIISPPTGLNRLAFGKRFKTPFPGHAPATFWRFRLGAALSGDSEQTATADFAMSYGLPGKPGYRYTRPLDHFDFQISGFSTAANPLEIVLLRGMLYGKPYQAGDNYRGIWGIYGGYDYISPGSFRVSNTALSLGTTAQYWVAQGVALQGTLLGGAGFGAAGVTPEGSSGRDYHYGLTPQGILALRLLFGDRAVLETVARGYYVSGTGSDNAQGAERIARATANLNLRVTGRHGIGLQFVKSIRDAHYFSQPDRRQSDRTVSVVYTYAGATNFGAVEWRNQER
ncbi:MAG: hypothetical protein A2075_18180 [Geobacteraceae bacterium GWC2_58_44]|nr:MAG: hypothetical protein A2075_18180 [Geobacteraceae bacterium GWC2_58_44]HBG05451.1 DUF3943 domain-containing protein [Geobacter sp.]